MADRSARFKKSFRENAPSLVTALVVVFAIRSVLVESFKIPTGSMIPTLAIGDYLFVNKLAYGVRVPFSDWITHYPTYIIHRNPPKRGQILVFRYPKDESIYFIKRVVGVPGDEIEMRDKVLYINHQPLKYDPAPAEMVQKVLDQGDISDPQYTVPDPEFWIEHLGDVNHIVMFDKTNFRGRDFGPVTVPPENLFAMGDNRDVSNDSRYWGFVPFRNVTGRAVVIWFSLYLGFSEGQILFHPSRIGTLPH